MDIKSKLTLVPVDSLGELIKSRGDLQSLEKNSLLTLDANVFGPLDETSEISLWLDVSSDSKVTSILREQWALHLTCSSFGARTCCHHFLAFSNFLHLRKHLLTHTHWQRDLP